MKLLSFVSFSLYAITSGSMAPALNIGDLVVVIPQNKYFKGDVITYRTFDNNHLSTHRIENVEGNVYRTKGDANLYVDKMPTVQQKIIGKVIYKVPFAGFIAITAKFIGERVASSCEILLNRLLSQRYG